MFEWNYMDAHFGLKGNMRTWVCVYLCLAEGLSDLSKKEMDAWQMLSQHLYRCCSQSWPPQLLNNRHTKHRVTSIYTRNNTSQPVSIFLEIIYKMCRHTADRSAPLTQTVIIWFKDEEEGNGKLKKSALWPFFFFVFPSVWWFAKKNK